MPAVSIFPGLPSSPPLAAMIGIVADKPVRHSSGTRIAFSADAPFHRTTPGVKSPFIHLGREEVQLDPQNGLGVCDFPGDLRRRVPALSPSQGVSWHGLCG